MALFSSYGPGLVTNSVLKLLEDGRTVDDTATALDPCLEIRSFEHELLASGRFVGLDFLALGLVVNGWFL